MNQYYCDVLPDLRWGIFYQGRLLASVATQSDAKRMLRYLKARSIAPTSEPTDDRPYNQVIPGQATGHPKRRKKVV